MDKFPYEHISVLVMPTDYCNMNCVYCFNSRRTCLEKKTISEENLKKIFDIIIPYYNEIKFIWHGGEPLSMGKEFYEKVVELQKQYDTKGKIINNSIQTNLSLMTNDLAKFFINNKFHIGSSFDGTTNEKTRHNTNNIMKGYETYKKNGGHNGFICVIQKNNINKLIEDYNWFKEKHINYTLNKYLTSNPESDDLYVDSNTYNQKMCEFFDYWLYDTKCNISVSYYDNFIKYILFGKKELCCYNSCMGKHIGIHYDGNIYGCNRDFPEKYCYGNINDYNDIHECFKSNGFNELLKDAIKRRNSCKEKCDIYEFCSGGCNSVAIAGGDVTINNDEDCKSLIHIYNYVKEAIDKWKMEEKKCINDNLNPYVAKFLLKYKENNI